MAGLTIPERFNGPPGSGQGGMTCGLLAEALGLRAAAVSLRVPPPLGRGLRVAGHALLDEDRVVAEATPRDVVDPGPVPGGPVPVELAEASATQAVWGELHPFPTCFVCGPARPDGLRLFAGPVAGREGVYAAAWTPRAGETGVAFVWGALDCPSVVPVIEPGEPDYPFVLARLEAELLGEPVPGEPHAVVAWPVAREGRKRTGAVALHRADGTLVARGRALWIGLQGRPLPGA